MTPERARELFSYEPDTGVLRWRERHGSGGRLPAGAVVRGADRKGYLRVTADGRTHRVNRLAWMILHGRAPDGDIDHINGVKDDNRAVNLRDVSRAVNLQNKPAAGVRKEAGAWCASIKANGARHYLGRFRCFGKAVTARKEAERLFHPEKVR